MCASARKGSIDRDPLQSRFADGIFMGKTLFFYAKNMGFLWKNTFFLWEKHGLAEMEKMEIFPNFTMVYSFLEGRPGRVEYDKIRT